MCFNSPAGLVFKGRKYFSYLEMPVASSECGMSSFMYELGWRMESTYSWNTESTSMDMNMFLIVLYSQRVGSNEQMCQWRYMWRFKHEHLGLNSDPHVSRVSSSPTEILDSTDSKLFIRIIFLSSEKNHVRYKLLPQVQKTKCEITFVIVRQMECVWSGVGSQGCITVLVNAPESYSSLICSGAFSTKTTWHLFKSCFTTAVLNQVSPPEAMWTSNKLWYPWSWVITG